jgi:hypothetical protein
MVRHRPGTYLFYLLNWWVKAPLIRIVALLVVVVWTA